MKTINMFVGLIMVFAYTVTQEVGYVVFASTFFVYAKIDQAKEEIIKHLESKQNEF